MSSVAATAWGRGHLQRRLHLVIRSVDVDAVGLEQQLQSVEVALASGPTDGRGPEIAAVIHVAAVPQVGNAVRGPAVSRPDEWRVPRGVTGRDVVAGLETSQVAGGGRLPRVRIR